MSLRSHGCERCGMIFAMYSVGVGACAQTISRVCCAASRFGSGIALRFLGRIPLGSGRAACYPGVVPSVCDRDAVVPHPSLLKRISELGILAAQGIAVHLGVEEVQLCKCRIEDGFEDLLLSVR
ncbi:hypothetical protein BDV36DRAFT_302925 [Aspergillus pseudocaelatus]|uniref:Uncharacterized protein n=1 Tax=Aspergillus pseudocaelatus TaxID=1825620 RepID=A0ABQ6W4G9_9EURO|nr:hypothetical protein BDV36DRAFT_302925 [Aspergillus pseudocaelatus]